MNDNFEEMSEDFNHAYSYSSQKKYKQSIPLYDDVILKEPNNWAALHNRGVAKIWLGIENKDLQLINIGIKDIKEAIRITVEVENYKDGYPLAEGNLKWAEDEISKLKN